MIKFKSPKVTERKVATARLALVNSKGKVVNDTALEIEIFPKNTSKVKSGVYTLTRKDSWARQLCKELKVEPNVLGKKTQGVDVILVEDFEVYSKHKAAILKAVENGARVVFMDLPVGQYKIANETVNIKESSFNPLHFASRKTGHPMVEGFDKNAFRYLYEENDAMIAPFLHRTFTAEGFSAILTSGNLDEKGTWQTVCAAADKSFGQGSICVCQVQLVGRTFFNPTAKLFAQRLLGLMNLEFESILSNRKNMNEKNN